MRDIPNQVTLQEITPEYKQFVDKFKQKKTTDDCFTPDNVYRCVLQWVCDTYGVNEENVCRPFYPGGDYERYMYEKNSVVVDNPPFSILSEIIKFYNQHNIKYFLFAPHLTNFRAGGMSCCHVIAASSIVYENGAEISTSFVTNLDDRLIYADPGLYYKLKEENDKNRAEVKKQLPKYAYPDNVVTAAMVGYIVTKGIPYELERKNALLIGALDSQRPAKKSIFGGGFLVAEKAAAEKAAAEKAAAEIWELSSREREIIKRLGGNE